MVDGGIEGSIVNIASVHGLVASAPNLQAGYVASKTAVVGLTLLLAAYIVTIGLVQRGAQPQAQYAH